MARNMNRETLEQKIAKTEKAISRKREQYDRLTAELEDLHKKKKAILNEEILKAVFCGGTFHTAGGTTSGTENREGKTGVV